MHRASPGAPRCQEPTTNEQIRITYEYYADGLIPYLRRERLQVGEVPTWETFREHYSTENHWSAYQVVIDAGATDRPAEWQAINETCPQAPPLDDLFD